MPSRLNASLLACGLLAGGALQAQSSEYPLAINLPTVDRMQFWDLGVTFTHRFVTPVKDHGKDAYGLDGLAYAGLGLAMGFKPIKGLNILLYRTADNKTFTFGFQQQLMDHENFRMAFRAERFDEVVDRSAPQAGSTLNNASAYERGIFGGSFQVPMEVYFPGDVVTLTLVPTYLTRTTTSNYKFSDGAAPVYQPGLNPGKKGSGVFNYGLGVRVNFTEALGWITEYYPKPSRLPADTYKAGFATGITYKTFKHRFTVTATNVHGTTPNQVLGGDYDGHYYRASDNTWHAGPSPSGEWSLGFNVSRVF